MPTEPFNKLTLAEAERLAMLAEECAEVIAIIGKILRHGYDSYHPDAPAITNRDMLADELADVHAVTRAMKWEELRDYTCEDTIGSRWKKKLRYSHHQDDADAD